MSVGRFDEVHAEITVERPGRPPTEASGTAKLDQLWEGRIAQIIAGLVYSERQHQEIANAAVHIGGDYSGRFLIELLQNASDQAGNAGHKLSTIVVVRTREHLVVINEGMPFDESSVRSITSLALTTKNAEESLGNKGVGFKSVFRVSDGPELYSSSGPNQGVRDGLAWAFRLDGAPLTRPGVRPRARLLVEKLLAESPMARERIAEHTRKDVVESVLDEIEAAAPWKFPLPRTVGDLDELAATVGLSSDWLGSMQTVVVLPLLKDAATQEVVDTALDDIRSPATVLFLPNVSELYVDDRARGREERIHRQRIGAATVARGATFEEQEVSVSVVGAGSEVKQGFWVCSRTMGDEAGPDAASAGEEQRAIQAAAGLLKGKGWEGVRRATVAVALPQPGPNGRLPIREGKFCIGLPTRLNTGLPFWVDAHFHAYIARTDIDLALPYNKLLFDEATALVATLLEALKTSPLREVRRSVTLAMERTSGKLGDFAWQQGMAAGDVVLGADGATFLSPAALSLPRYDDLSMIRLLTGGDDAEARASGLVLPDAVLLERERPLIDALAKAAGARPADDGFFLARDEAGRSLLERAASRVRTRSDPAFWERFLGWVLDRFSRQLPTDQKILPVGRNALASADDRVFLEPMVSAGGEASADADEEIDVGSISEHVRAHLRFLDENVVVVRTRRGRDVTALVQRLSPLAGGGLVSRPHVDQLLRYAVVPRLVEVSQQPGHGATPMELLRFAIALVNRLKPTTRRKLETTLASIPVPAGASSEDVRWVAAGKVYFGPGWVDAARAELLQKAYGARAHSMLVPWEDFASMSGENDAESRPRWTEAMRLLGVESGPRVLEAFPEQVLRTRQTGDVVPVIPSSPIDAAKEYWLKYVTSLTTLDKNPRPRQYYKLARVAWLDGLENPAARPAIMAMALESPAHLPAVTDLRRLDGEAFRAPTLWGHAVASNNWPIIPAESDLASGLVEPSRVYWASAEDRRRPSTRFLLTVPQRFESAEQLLAAIGVSTLASATVERVIAALHDFAVVLASAVERQPSAARALLTDLWNGLRGHCSQLKQQAAGRIQRLVERQVPLLRGRTLEAVDLRQLETLYVDDDSVRGRFVQGLDHALQLPSLRDVRWLVTTLRALLGEERVVTTSDAPVDTGFVADTAKPPTRLMDFLEATFREADVVTDLGLLYAFPPGRAEVDPTKEEFSQFRTRLEKTRIEWGAFSFAPGSGQPTRSFYERGTSTLQMVADAAPVDVVEATWPIVGTPYQHYWAVYAQHLAERTLREFFAEQRIGEAEREAIEAALARGHAAKLARFRNVAFAIFRAKQVGASSTFATEWPGRTRHVNGLDGWLGGGLREALLQAIEATDEESASVGLLAAAGVSVANWQLARAELGLPPWCFGRTDRAIASATEALVVGAKSETARRFGVDLDAARCALDEIKDAKPDLTVRHQLLDEHAALSHVLEVAKQAFLRAGGPEKLGALDARLTELASADVDARQRLLKELGTTREKDIYRRETEIVRNLQAGETRDSVLRVATALAAKRNETIDPKVVASEARVAAFSRGYWANRFGLLVSLQHTLEATAPQTTLALSEKRAFRRHAPWRDLWLEFPELGPIPTADAPQPKPPRTIDLLGAKQREDEIPSALLQGSKGSVGQRLVQLVDAQLDFSKVGTGSRPAATLPTRKRGSGGRGGASGDNGTTNADRELNGVLGEAFVYEQFRARLDGFDEFAWVSKNRRAYGLTTDGDDTLGYDFLYLDDTGILSGRSAAVECCIEVKASSGEGTEAFPMTTNEWLCAQECHLDPENRCYIIVRVAGVRTQPRIVDIIRDPVAVAAAGQLAIERKDLWVHVGRTLPSPVGGHA